MYLEINHVSKKIKNDWVLNDITLSMDKGKIYGFRGENGSGKSMLMKVMCGLVLPTIGTVSINSQTLGKKISFPPSIGILIEHPGFLETYSGIDNLRILASIKKQVGDEEILQSLKRVGLGAEMNKKYKKYSLGMKQKLGIAAAIMEQPDFIILDEPTNGLDEASEKMLWQIIWEERNRGALIVVSCHTDEKLKNVSDEIYSLKMGQIKEHNNLYKERNI